jgi:hypothetical protein
MWAQPAVSGPIDTFAEWISDNTGWTAAYDLVDTAGGDHHAILIQWSDMCPVSACTDFSRIDRMVAASNGKPLIISIAVINSDGLAHRPSSIAALAWDNTTVSNAFKTLLDDLVSHLNGQMVELTIGNESNFYFGVNPAHVAPYAVFLSRVVPYAHTLYDGNGAFETSICWTVDVIDDITTFDAINDQIDLITWSMYDVADIPGMFAAMNTHANTYGNKFSIQEVGVSTCCSIPESYQSAVADAVFTYAEAYGASNRLRMITWFAAQDIADAVLIDAGLTEPTVSFFGRLGLRTTSNTAKAGWSVVVTHLGGTP